MMIDSPKTHISMLDEMIAKLDALPEDKLRELKKKTREKLKEQPFYPNPGPQLEAYLCEADELFYGGCVSEDTEFLTPGGWKRIDQYNCADRVANWSEDSRKLIFKHPTRYIEAPCGELIEFKHQRLSMRLSSEHRVPLYDYKGDFVVKTAQELAARPGKHTVPVNYLVNNGPIKLSETELRLIVAIHADGSLTFRKKKEGAYCRISLRKERKKTRLVNLLTALGIDWHEYRNPKRPTEVRYGFDTRFSTKNYSTYWGVSQGQLGIILDEMPYWDGGISAKNGGDICFNTTIKGDADFMQYAAHAYGRVANITTYPAVKEGHSNLYRVNISYDGGVKSVVSLRVDTVSVKRIQAERMYCFETDTGFWLARHNGHIFITGNSAGGGKTELVLGLANNCHTSSVLLRRYNEDARGMAERYLEVIGTRDGYNGTLLTYRDSKRRIHFAGCKDEKDKQRFKGKPADFFAFDEVGDFLESQYVFITAWNRSTAPGQRCRIVCTGNPPTTAEGLWVIDRWAPWLDPTHPNPAKDGELRWFTSDKNGQQVEVDGVGPHLIGGREVKARSRTFIRAELSDNPDLAKTDYGDHLSALPKELRDAYRDGRFDKSVKSNPMQIIPTEWVSQAQERWKDRPIEGVPMCNLAADIAQGGEDNNSIMARHDGWFSEIEIILGRDTPLGGADIAGMLVARRKDRCKVTIDCGGGYGGVVYTKLMDNEIDAYAYKGSEATTERTQDKTRIGFINRRTAAYWRLREGLDPAQDGGSPIMLPPDRELLQELTTPLFELTPRGYKMTPKDKVIQLLGRSPDKADVAAMCWYQGDKAITHSEVWRKDAMLNRGRKRIRQKVNPGFSARYARK